jgi:enoyl-CoA hydratase
MSDLLRVFREEPENLLEMLRLGAMLYERLLSFPTPVLVACGGQAIAAGSFLLLAADARIGVDGPFKIGMNEVQIGLTMPPISPRRARQPRRNWPD